MTDPEETDVFTGLTSAEIEAMADDLYEHRDEAPGPVVEFEYSPEIRSVVSVRFNRGEIGVVADAAAAAGVPLSTYIRNAALAAAAPIDIEAARRELRTAKTALAELERRLDAAAQGQLDAAAQGQHDDTAPQGQLDAAA